MSYTFQHKKIKSSPDGQYLNLTTHRFIKNKESHKDYHFLDLITIDPVNGKDFRVCGEAQILNEFLIENKLVPEHTPFSHLLQNNLVKGKVEDLKTSVHSSNEVLRSSERDKIGTTLFVPKSSSIRDVSDENFNSLSNFQLLGVTGEGRVKKIIDGDTIDLAIFIDLGYLSKGSRHIEKKVHSVKAEVFPLDPKTGFFTLYRIRLYGIDAMEKNTKAGVKASELMAQKYKSLKGFLYYKSYGMDKYGRLLLELFEDKEMKNCINYHLLDYKDPELGVLVERYDGGTKSTYAKGLERISLAKAPAEDKSGLGAVAEISAPEDFSEYIESLQVF